MKKALVNPLKIHLHPLHIKLGIMMQFVKAPSKNGPCFMYIGDKFKYLSNAELKKLIKDEKFEKIMYKNEENA